MKSNCFFSIIIPAYNVEKYIEQSVNSILNQTYQNFEIIIINDGSKDNTGKIIDKLYQNNSKIKIIHKENEGLSKARNTGIKKSIGEYLIFLDGDDYWNSNEALAQIFTKIKKDKNDLVMIGLQKYFEETKTIVNKKLFDSKIPITIKNLLKTNYYKASACDKIIKKSSFINNDLTFPEGLLSEDIIYCSNLLNKVKNIGLINENIYVYRQHKSSITKNINVKNIEDILTMLKEGLKNKNSLNYNYLAYEYTVVLGLISTSKGTKNIPKNLKVEVFKLKFLLNYNLNYKVKMVYILSKVIGIKATSKLLGKFIDLKT